MVRHVDLSSPVVDNIKNITYEQTCIQMSLVYILVQRFGDGNLCTGILYYAKEAIL